MGARARTRTMPAASVKSALTAPASRPPICADALVHFPSPPRSSIGPFKVASSAPPVAVTATEPPRANVRSRPVATASTIGAVTGPDQLPVAVNEPPNARPLCDAMVEDTSSGVRKRNVPSDVLPATSTPNDTSRSDEGRPASVTDRPVIRPVDRTAASVPSSVASRSTSPAAVAGSMLAAAPNAWAWRMAVGRSVARITTCPSIAEASHARESRRMSAAALRRSALMSRGTTSTYQRSAWPDPHTSIVVVLPDATIPVVVLMLTSGDIDGASRRHSTIASPLFESAFANLPVPGIWRASISAHRASMRLVRRRSSTAIVPCPSTVPSAMSRMNVFSDSWPEA